MTAGDGVPLWRRRWLQLLAVAAIALLAWVCFYLETVPAARRFGDDDSARLALSADRPLALTGLPAGKVLGFRLVGAKRLDLTLPPGTVIVSPRLAPFLAKAAREAETLAGISCSNTQPRLNALTEAHESVSVTATLVDSADGAAKRALLLQRPDPTQAQAGLRLSANGARLRLAVDLNRSVDEPQGGSMLLCIEGRSATLGHAEFELPADAVVAAHLADLQAGQDPVAFDFYGSEGAGLPVEAIALGPLGRDGLPEPQLIACGAGAREWLWRRPVPTVRLADCQGGDLAVTGLDLAAGRLTVVGGFAFFHGLKPEDAARVLSRATANPVLQLLFGALLSTLLFPWAFAQFKRREASKAQPAKRAPRSRATRRR